MNLRRHQVVQSLVVDATNEDFSRIDFTSFTVDHGFTTGVSQSVSDKTVTQTAFLFSTECGTINSASFEGADLTTNHFQDVSHGHSRRDSVRVDDQVRHNTVSGEGHVLWVNKASNDTLLSVSRSELVTDFRNLVASDHHSDQAARVEGFCDVDVVDPSFLTVANKHG